MSKPLIISMIMLVNVISGLIMPVIMLVNVISVMNMLLIISMVKVVIIRMVLQCTKSCCYFAEGKVEMVLT